jgi:hypothetical protein
MNKKTLAILLASSFAMLACTTTETQSRREESARPRVEQRALSNAIDMAFKQVNLSQVEIGRAHV